MNTRICNRVMMMLTAMAMITAASASMRADVGTCGGVSTTLPFTDVAGNPFFCAIAEAYFSGLTNGTSATTYSPTSPVPREQMAAFITRTLDQSLKRGSRRAALRQFWTTQGANDLALTIVGHRPYEVESDGADLWVANYVSGTVSRVRASDGRLLETWIAEVGTSGVLVARGKVFVICNTAPGSLFQIDPTQPAGVVTLLSTGLGAGPKGIAYDGQRIWTANSILPPPTFSGSVSIISLNPVTVTNITAGFALPHGILYDGTNIWVTDKYAGTLLKLNSLGQIQQTVVVGNNPERPVFDGTNIWVPNQSDNTVTVVRASTGVVIATLSGNGLNSPRVAAFDGERILVTNYTDNSVSLWKATDLTPIGTFSTGAGTDPIGACSDGLNFWITLWGTDRLARF
ncbi:MAG TPA: S-layer homology domain-containing protein [Blastocatellia bacterium]|nr:S-layer homology domain-containing protein [Blastocatellia bacterium]